MLAASTERSISVEVDFTRVETSFEAATSALCAFNALFWIASVVFAATLLIERSISEEIALSWPAVSVEVAVSMSCASRAPLTITETVSVVVVVRMVCASRALPTKVAAVSAEVVVSDIWA